MYVLFGSRLISFLNNIYVTAMVRFVKFVAANINIQYHLDFSCQYYVLFAQSCVAGPLINSHHVTSAGRFMRK